MSIITSRITQEPLSLTITLVTHVELFQSGNPPASNPPYENPVVLPYGGADWAYSRCRLSLVRLPWPKVCQDRSMSSQNVFQWAVNAFEMCFIATRGIEVRVPISCQHDDCASRFARRTSSGWSIHVAFSILFLSLLPFRFEVLCFTFVSRRFCLFLSSPPS